MMKRFPELEEPLLDIVSLARRGPTGRLSLQEVELVVRTLRRTPEVMVKVSGGATSTPGALAHLKYIDRRGELELETDEGERLQGGTLSAPYSKNGSLTCLPPGPGRPIGVAPGAGPQNCCTTLFCLCLRAHRQKSFLPQAETLHARSLRLNTDTSWSCTLTRNTHTCTWS